MSQLSEELTLNLFLTASARLRCKVSDGMFSREYLVKFNDADGSEQSAFVADRSVTKMNGGDEALLRVRRSDEVVDNRVLVGLPTADGDRFWVRPTDLVEN